MRTTPLFLEPLEDRLVPSTATTTSIAASPGSVVAGQSTTLTATVAASVVGFGINGDSLSDEYAETASASGIDNRAYAQTWDELLSSQRGINFGSYASFAEPRRAGFTYNWARDGATSTTLLSSGQDTGLAAQIQAGLVNYAVLAIGQNDFAPDNQSPGAYPNIYAGNWTQAQIQNYEALVVGNIESAMNTLTATGVSLVVSDVIDYGVAPATQAAYPDASKRELVTSVIKDINTQINAYALAHSVPVADFFALSKSYFGQNASPIASQKIGGFTINSTAGMGYDNAFVADGIHPQTAVSAIIANLYLETFQLGYGADFLGAKKFSEHDILNILGIGSQYTGDTLNLNYASFVLVPSTLPPQVGQPTGSVQFTDNGTNVGAPVTLSAAANNAATASLPATINGVGVHTLGAVYLPIGTYAASNGSSLLVATPPHFAYDAAGRVLTITADAATNSFTYARTSTQDASGVHTTSTFTLNGTSFSLDNVLLFQVLVNATAGASTAVLSTNDTYTNLAGQTVETVDLVDLAPGGGYILRTDTLNVEFLLLSGFKTSYAYVGRNDQASIFGIRDANVENVFVSAGNYAYLFGAGEFHLISGARAVYSFAQNADDQAWHYDAAGSLDAFVVSGNAFSYMSGTDASGASFFNVAQAYQVNYGIATHGHAIAYLIDSPGNDVFVGNAPYSYMSGRDADGSLFNVAEGFALVYAQSFVGGTDYAYNYDPSHNILAGFIRLV